MFEENKKFPPTLYQPTLQILS